MGNLGRVGVVLAVVGVLVAGISWNRYQHDSSANDWRRQRIDQAERISGPGGGLLQAEREPVHPETLWLGVLVGSTAVALAGGGLVAVSRAPDRDRAAGGELGRSCRPVS